MQETEDGFGIATLDDGWKFVSFDERTKDRKYPGEKDVFQRRFILVPRVSMRV